MFNRVITVTMLSLAAVVSLRAGELSEPQTTELLGKLASLNKDRNYMQAEFRESHKRVMTKEPIVRSGTLWLKLPNQFRREIPGNSTLVSDGTTFWMYYPALNTTEVYPLGKERQVDENIAAITAGFDLVRLGENYKVTAFDEGSGWRLELIPKRSLKKKVTKLNLWLNKDYGIERVEAILKKGEVLDTTFRNMKRGSFSDSIFKFSPPKDSEVSKPLERQ